jgi:hypothetical protein
MTEHDRQQRKGEALRRKLQRQGDKVRQNVGRKAERDDDDWDDRSNTFGNDGIDYLAKRLVTA